MENRDSRSDAQQILPSSAVLLFVALLVAGGLGWLAWSWMGSDGDSAPSGSRSAATDSVAAGAEPPGDAEVPDPSAEPLPPLDESDFLVRRLAEEISNRPAVASWFVSDGLVRRFVVAVTNVANGGSPSEQVDFVEVEGDFQVRDQDGRTLIDPASYRRYDGLTAAFVSLDPQGSAALYRRLSPLFDAAYRELGLGADGFEPVLASAVRELLAVEIPSPPVQVQPEGAMYAYSDPVFEAGTPAEKHLMRMGPDNARRVQEKLRQLAGALELDMAEAGRGG